MAQTSGGGKGSHPREKEERRERAKGGRQRLMGFTTKCEMKGDRHLEKRFVFL